MKVLEYKFYFNFFLSSVKLKTKSDTVMSHHNVQHMTSDIFGTFLTYLPTVVCIKVRTASFPRFWKNHPWCRNKWYLIWTGCFFHWDEAKKIQNGRLKKFKMADSKKSHFPAPPILNIFSWNFHGLVLSRIGWCKGDWCGSTYMVLRL